MRSSKRLLASLVVSISASIAVSAAFSQHGTSVDAGDWPDYNGDLSAQRYSPLEQINAENVGSLQIAWRFATEKFGPSPEFNNPSNPLEIDGVLYTTMGATRNVVALDATNGQILWMWAPREGQRFNDAPRKGAGRGVSFWRDGDTKRVLTLTPGFHLASLDAETGVPDPNFGENGIVDLFVGLRNADDFPDIDIGASAAPFVMNDVVVVGPAHRVGMRPRSKSNVKGDVRGFDVRTGALLWTFKTIPDRGEVGFETWLDSGVEFTGNAGVWSPISGDPELGHVYLPVESATGDRFGGDRPGDNLFANALVAVDIKTGERIWHHQLIHHDIWDWDNPSAAVLADLPNGRKVVMQVTKQSWVYTYDRLTGEPVWPIEEQPVPAGDVPTEWYSPTQPFVTRPAPFDRQGFTEADLIDFTPELRAEALAAIANFRLSPNLYTPPSLAEGSPDGTVGVLSLPSATGGANWEGSALDPETGILYVPSRTALSVLSVEKDPDSDLAFSQAFGVRVPRVRGLEIVKPPYGRVTAIDMNSGDHVFMVANADTPASIANNPALAGINLERTGVATRSGVLVTKTLLFIGEGGPGGGTGLYVHNKLTGELITRIELPNTQSGGVFTYEHNGKQYLAMFVSGSGNPTELLAYALP